MKSKGEKLLFIGSSPLFHYLESVKVAEESYLERNETPLAFESDYATIYVLSLRNDGGNLMFQRLLTKIEQLTPIDFDVASNEIIGFIDACDDFLSTLKQIGTIPESIEHDSTQEKLFSKASDAALARAFREIGLKSTVLKERGDSADVQAESIYHGYTLVADAKAFRLSRTAKNQKDFKVNALSAWRKDSEYAVLCSPYFQYPVSNSQIFAQAVDNNVCLFSWEHLIFLIENGIKETEIVNLSCIWNSSGEYAKHCTVAEKKKSFISLVDEVIINVCQKSKADFKAFLLKHRNCIADRAREETTFWRDEIDRISSYTKEEAIAELIKAKKIYEKITQIEKYIAGIIIC